MSIRPSYISIVLVVLLIVAQTLWLAGQEENTVVTILASREIRQGLPVFAQFTVSQSLYLKEIASISRLVVPFYVPRAGAPLKIRMMRHNKPVGEWRLPGELSGLVEAQFVIDPPQLIDGEVMIEFDGRDIRSEDKDWAPRLFIESADAAYPEGSYRIADNAKKGDVALTLVGRQTRLAQRLDQFRQAPLQQLAKAGTMLLVLMLVAALPYQLRWPAKQGLKSV